MNDRKIFNEDKLLAYIMDYDYIYEKYNIKKNDEGYLECAEFESAYQNADVVKRDYSSIYDNIKLVYGDDEKANRMMYIYKIIKEEVVNKFLNIPGLERLYDEHFFEFEWDMHSRLDFDSHGISFYRDHFVHQVRNFFEMNKFLDNKLFFENFKKEFIDGDNKISSYVQYGIRRIVRNAVSKNDNAEYYHPSDTDLKSWRASVETEDGIPSEKELQILKYTDFYLCYIIKASIALCALFHDIGYPIIHFEKLQKRISGFMPSLYMFLSGDITGFEHIYSSLCNSLLFRIVSKEELQKSVCDGENHGAVSAVAFLLVFYENGNINSISEEKRIAIEIAAVAIYNHTIKYRCIDKDEGKSYYRPIYKLNPLSYLLRICDDMQEWERTYFEIQNIPDFVICEKCGTPLLQTVEMKSIGKGEHNLLYSCRCMQKKYIKKYDDFVRRSIIDIVNCKEVRVEFMANLDRSKNIIYVYLDYNPALLLKMCLLAPRYVKYRIKDLNKFRTILSAQKFGGYDAAYVDFMLTSNPFLLKAQIVGGLMELYEDADDEFYDLLHNAVAKNKSDKIDLAWGSLKKKTYIGAAEFLLKNNGNMKKQADKSDTKKIKKFLTSIPDFSDVFDADKPDWHGICKRAIESINKELKLLTDIDKTQEIVREIYRKVFESEYGTVFNNYSGNVYMKVLSKIKSMYSRPNRLDTLSEGNAKGFEFYYILYIMSGIFATINSDENYTKWTEIDFAGFMPKRRLAEFIKEWLYKKVKTINRNMDIYEVRLFVDDAVEQYSKLFDCKKVFEETACRDEYYAQWETKDSVYCAVERYSYRHNPINENMPEALDYYSDLDMYIRFSEYTRGVRNVMEYYDMC